MTIKKKGIFYLFKCYVIQLTKREECVMMAETNQKVKKLCFLTFNSFKMFIILKLISEILDAGLIMTYLDCRVPTADDNETERSEMEWKDGQWRDRVAARRCRTTR
jgi:hypothetical protein